MATPANMTQFDALMKELYSTGPIPFSAIKRSPFLASLNHNKNARGNHLVVPIEYSNGGGRSAVFSKAQSNTQGSSNAKLLVNWVSDYADAMFNGDVVDFSSGDGAIEDVITREVESKNERLMNSMCSALYGDGTGRAGQSSTTDSGATITLTNKYDIVNFKYGDWITAAAPGATSVRTGNIQITGIDRSNGVLSFGNYVTGSIPTFQPGDVLYQDGDFGTTSSPTKLTGLRGWLPGKAGVAGTFFGVNRATDQVELGGWTHDFAASPVTMEDAIIQAAMDVVSTDGVPDMMLMNVQDWRKLEISLASLIRYEQADFRKDGAVYGFKSIAINAGIADVKVLPDAFCPQGEAFLLTSNTWKLYTAGDAPKVLDRDGLYVRYLATDDVLECRLAYRGNLVCTSPKQNSHLYLPVTLSR